MELYLSTASRRNLAHLEHEIPICGYYLFNIVDISIG